MQHTKIVNNPLLNVVNKVDKAKPLRMSEERITRIQKQSNRQSVSVDLVIYFSPTFSLPFSSSFVLFFVFIIFRFSSIANSARVNNVYVVCCRCYPS